MVSFLLWPPFQPQPQELQPSSVQPLSCILSLSSEAVRINQALRQGQKQGDFSSEAHPEGSGLDPTEGLLMGHSKMETEEPH